MTAETADSKDFGSMTGRDVMSIFPQVIIGGAQKCGTTSLHRLLRSHPDIFVPRWPQEIHYFDVHENFRRGPAWYGKHFRRWHGQRIVAQTSPLYLYEPLAARRIRDLLSKVKLIFILRDPVDRAYSHYWHEVRYGVEDLSFEEALRRESERLMGGFEQRRCFSYVDRGRYATQLQRFVELFPREHILVLQLDELRSDSFAVCRRLGQFLDVDPDGFAAKAGRRWCHNEARLPRSAGLQRSAASLRQQWPVLGYMVDVMNLRKAQYPPMVPSTRATLREHFSDELDRLAAEWPIDVEVWRTPSE